MDHLLFTPAAWPEDEDELEEDEEGDDALSKRLVFDCPETPQREGRQTSKKQSVVVFLRVRPKNQREILSMDADCLHVVSQRELQAVAPVTSQTFKNKAGVRCPAESSQIFSFTHIFDEKASQRHVFEESMLPTLKDFFGGQNCLVFTYGVTNSGKTYTVTGTPTEPGILPRSLDLIFNSISPQQLSSLQLRPKNFSDVAYITEEEMERELARKDDILNKAREMSVCEVNGMEDTAELTTDSDTSTLSKASSNYSKVSDSGTSLDDIQIQVQDGTTVDLEDAADVCYSVWVSFAEIYNEFIYDLLAEPKTRRGRPSLKLAEDKNHNHFIKGLLEVGAASMEEALLLLKLGLRQRHMASTRLNYQSSRSHTIFTIKLIKMVNAGKPQVALVNRISVVDLAGAERSMKTGAIGMRVKEAGNINNSLLTLGKCIEAMRHNQNKRRGEEHVVPFRESKLTRLFQNYFVGKGKGVRQGRITMLVNVSNSASVFDETAHVLKFSAITSKVIPIVKQTPARHTAQPHPPASSQHPVLTAAAAAETPRPGRRGKTTLKADATTIKAKRTVSVTVCEQCKLAREESAKLQKKICDQEVEMMESEYNIRQEVCREFQEQLIEIEDAHREELEVQAEDMQEMYEKRMQLLQKSMKKQFNRKRRRVETAEEEEEEEGEGEMEGEGTAGKSKGRVIEGHLREKVAELQEQLQVEKDKAVALSAELKDALETHESRVIRLNQQVNGLSLELERREKELQDELTAAARATEAAKGREAERASNCESLQRQLEMANSKVLEVTKENESLGNERLSLISEYEGREGQLREETEALKAELQQVTKVSTDLTAKLEQTQREMEIAAREHREIVQRTDASREDAVAEVEILQARISELTQEAKLVSASDSLLTQESAAEIAGLQEQVQELQAANHELTEKVREESEKVHSLSEELTLVKEELGASRQQLTQRYSQQLQSLVSSEASKQEALHSELTSLQCQLAAKQEVVQKLEMELKEKVTGAEERLAAKNKEIQALCEQINEKDDMIGSLHKALQEAETVLETQTTRISDMNGELEGVHSSIEALEERTTSLQTRLTKTQAEKSSLSTQVEELTAQIEEGQRTLAQRESELQASSDQCRSLMEQQLAEVKTALSAAQQELTQAREEGKTLQQQLRDKEGELLALATSSSEDKTAAHLLSSEVRSLKETVESLQEEQKKTQKEHRAQLEAVQGNHQLETTSLNCRVRELLEREETLQQAHSKEVAQWFKQVSMLKQESEKRAELETKVTDLEQQLEGLTQEKERERAGESTENPHVYEEPPEQLADEPTVYENESLSTTVLQPLDNKPDRMSTSHLTRSDSKPFIAILERSSQLVEDTFSEEPRIVIDATPPIAKRGRRGQRRKKRSIEDVTKGEGGVTPGTKKGKYLLRNRQKHHRFTEEDSEENCTPIDKVPNIKKIITRSTKKIAALATRPPSPSAPAPTQHTTRRTRRAIRKSQISLPLGLNNFTGTTIPHRAPLGLYLS